MPRTNAPVSLTSQDIPQVVRVCSKKFNQFFRRTDLAFDRSDQLARKVTLYALVGSGQASLHVNDRRYVLHQLFPTKPELRVGVLLNFQFKGPRSEHDLVHVSVMCAQGATSESITPTFRAEWDLLVTGREKSQNAQPHWHVYNPGAKLPVYFVEPEFEPARDFEYVARPEETSVRFEQLGMHFAMAARWHESGPGAHYSQLTSADNLANWLIGCLHYVGSQ